MQKKEETKILVHPQTEMTPADLAISRHMQNMYATYGEEKVRNSLKELFGLEFKPVKKNNGRKTA